MMETITKILHPTASSKVAVITGVEKGIGYSVAKQLLKLEPHWTIYVTAQDAAAGEEAYKKLKAECNSPALFYFRHLDPELLESIRQFRDYIKHNHSRGIYLLVNNVGKFRHVQVQPGAGSTGSTVAEATTERPERFSYDRLAVEAIVRSVYFGTLNLCEELLPIISDDGRIVFVSSRLAQMTFVNSTTETQQKIANCTKISDLNALIESFLATNPDALYTTAGWMSKPPETQLTPRHLLGSIYPLGIAKLAINLLTIIYQRQFDAEKRSKNILFNAVCPGIVKSEMAEESCLGIEEGADTILYAAMLPKDSMIRGAFLAERKVLDPFVIPDEALYR